MLSQLRWTGPSLGFQWFEWFTTAQNGNIISSVLCRYLLWKKISISLPERCVPEIETLLDGTVVIDIFPLFVFHVGRGRAVIHEYSEQLSGFLQRERSFADLQRHDD